MTDTRLLDEGLGLIALGLYDEAEHALRSVTTEDATTYRSARWELAELLLGEGRFEESAEIGKDLMAHGRFGYPVILTTSLALDFLGKTKEAPDLYYLVRACGRSLEREGYQMACFSSRLGEFPEALRWLLCGIYYSTEYWARSMTDADLTGLWSWLANRSLTLGEARSLLEAPLVAIHATALEKEDDLWLTANDLAVLDESTRRLFRYDYRGGCYRLYPLAVAADPEAADRFRSFRRSRLAVAGVLIGLIRSNAAGVVRRCEETSTTASAKTL